MALPTPSSATHHTTEADKKATITGRFQNLSVAGQIQIAHRLNIIDPSLTSISALEISRIIERARNNGQLENMDSYLVLSGR